MRSRSAPRLAPRAETGCAKAAFSAVWLLAAFLPVAAADLSVGGQASLSYDLDCGRRLDGEWGEDVLRYSFGPIASYSGSAEAWAWELRAKARFDVASRPVQGAALLESAAAKIWAGDYLFLEAAYGTDDPAAAEAFPLSTFLGPADPLARLEDWSAESRRSEPFLRLGAAVGSLRASFLCAPLAPPLVLPSLSSPFFPRNAVPTTILISTSTYRLRSLSYIAGEQYGAADLEGARSWAFDPSYLVQAGASLGPLDLGLSFFDGLERAASLYPVFRLSAAVPAEYDIAFEPRRARVRTLGASATLVSGALRTWAEASYAWGASLATGSAYWDALYDGLYIRVDGDRFTSEVPPIVSRDRFAATWGASLQPPWTGISAAFLAELTWARFLDAPAGCEPPGLSRAAVASAAIGEPTGRLRGSLACIVSLADWSLALRPSLGYSFGGDRSLELAAPFFLGAADSELGQYSSRRYATLSFVRRF